MNYNKFRTIIKPLSSEHVIKDYIQARNKHFRLHKNQFGASFRLLKKDNIKIKTKASGVYYYLGEEELSQDELIDMTKRFNKEAAEAKINKIQYKTV